ncbi:uncharacterized protein [Temnothorax longispinosus]|uniref:uncharacterized protein n=1 Tax=Temnothorax longispinosus TaxID=300112 RepID=UPI003A98F729
MPVCPECENQFSNIRALWLHLSIVHKTDKFDKFRCHEEKCFRVFCNWDLFRRHLVFYHNFHISSSFESSLLIQHNERSRDDMDIDNKEDSTESNQCNDQCMEHSSNISKNVNDLILRFLSKLYANHQLPRSFVQELTIDVKQLFAEFLSIIKPVINEKLRHKGIENNAMDELGCLLDSFLESFSNFSTEYRRFKALTIRESGHLIPIHDYIIGDRIDDKIIHGVMVKEIVSVHAQFIPMTITLQKLFSLPDVLSLVKDYMRELEKETEILENFIQVQLWKNKVAKYFSDKFVIPLFLYFDDFEVNNALGSHTGIQKLGALYYFIACFPPQVNSLLENIFMASFFHSSDRVVFQNHKIFHNVIDELNFLQSEGILVNTENRSEQIYFALGLVMGDNLGLNSILGFIESFNAAYYCRLCKTHKEVAQYNFKESRFRLDTYFADVVLEDTNVTGIKEKSVWNEVRYFSTKSNFSVDWLHDGPEGWFAFLMKLILHHFICVLSPVENRL